MSTSAGLWSHSMAISRYNLQRMWTENLAPENLDFQVYVKCPSQHLAQRRYLNITFPHFNLVTECFKYLIDYAFSVSSTTAKSRYCGLLVCTQLK